MRTKLCIALLFSTALIGCASAMKEGKKLPGQYVASESDLKKELTAKPVLSESNTFVAQPVYTVVKGDCLWRVSEKVYGDPFLWPSLAMNISSADCIVAGQQLFYLKSLGTETQHFVQEAKDRKPYTSKPCK